MTLKALAPLLNADSKPIAVALCAPPMAAAFAATVMAATTI
jgi:hypothetical protein